jgi:hypothetical protein
MGSTDDTGFESPTENRQRLHGSDVCLPEDRSTLDRGPATGKVRLPIVGSLKAGTYIGKSTHLSVMPPRVSGK